jgi:hypothetical protein
LYLQPIPQRALASVRKLQDSSWFDVRAFNFQQQCAIILHGQAMSTQQAQVPFAAARGNMLHD